MLLRIKGAQPHHAPVSSAACMMIVMAPTTLGGYGVEMSPYLYSTWHIVKATCAYINNLVSL